ncbi:hypothetical protein I0Q12_19335 [Rhodococcus sp. CX]|uniref:hypothetical protein n=1 Tax=Rhodococcus sp. CX TaxID=2789880 RepID=UPI0018CD24E1|nr:hypothetical protein [Rhodococcus sp. CX]MBH0121546.1 hypothetical protein [Rhodococcus sp. CX]
MSLHHERQRAQHGHPMHRDHTEDLETGIASAVREIDEMRAALNSVRGYAQSLRDLATVTRDVGGDYLARVYDDIATTLERKIGDRP